MKARFVTKAALSALALAFAGTLPGMAQQTASPAAAPAVDQVKASAVEKAFMKKMADIVQAGLKAGALDMKAVSGVLSDAAKAGVSDHVMGAMVSMAAGAFPSNAPAVASAAVRSYGPGVKEEQVRNVIASAVSSQPHPYASVAPISEAVEKALGKTCDKCGRRESLERWKHLQYRCEFRTLYNRKVSDHACAACTGFRISCR